MPTTLHQLRQSIQTRGNGTFLLRRVLRGFVGPWGLTWGVLLALSGPALGAEDRPLERFQATQVEMGVPVRITLYAPDKTTAKGALDAAFAKIQALNAILSDYDSGSELSRLSAASPTAEPVKLSDDLWNVLERSQALARKTEGAFDVTVGPYVRLWRRARRQKEMPSAERLAQARAAVGYQKLVLDADTRTASLQVPNMRLDLGGIAMGYAVDEAMSVIRAKGINRVLIDASGDILAADPPPGEKGWSISIVPLSEEGTPTRDVLLANSAIATSGDAFQYVILDGRRYSHIVDPKTGLGLSDQTAVTVIARDCVTVDSLATAASVLGPVAGMKLISQFDGAAAYIVRNRGGVIEVFETPNLGPLISRPAKD